jgi:rare lipoprotein A (peptidoglycan hydrolase)
MRITIKTPTASLALIAATACLLAVIAGSASADTGGAAADAPPVKGKVHTTGVATWFGPGFYGKQTACGQTLTPSVIGVANRTLPCGTLIKVSYQGRALTVPVLDRGPYSSIGADWDLTAGAAQALDITTTVRIGTRVVGDAPNTPTLGLPAGAQSETLAGGVPAGAPVAAE